METNALLEEINRLALAERLQLVEDLWDSVAIQAASLPLTDKQRIGLDRRIALHQADPKRGISMNDIVQKLGVNL